MKKQVFIKTYTRAGTYTGVYFDFSFSKFTKSLNGGLGDLEVVIPRKFDDFGEDTSIFLGGELKIYIADAEAINGTLIYSGEIDEIHADIDDEESVSINCSGYVAQLATDILQKSTPTANTVAFNYLAADPSNIIKNILDNYQAARTDDKITYTSSTIPLTGKSLGLKFYVNTPLAAINAAAQLADSDWFWHITADNMFYFNEISTTADHYFIFGKDVASLKIRKSLRDTQNGVLFSNGLSDTDPEKVFKLYSDPISISSYGRRFELKRDDRYKASSGSADQFGARFVAIYKDPLNTVTARIIDSNLANGYDIESIQPGDTCKFLNISENSALTDNMLITTIDYNIDYVDIVLVDAIQYTDRLLFERKNAYDAIAFDDSLPKYYTT